MGKQSSESSVKPGAVATDFSISFVVPALNEEANIRATAEEILKVVDGRFSTYEIILVNDASSDATGAIMESLAAEYKGIRVIHNSKNMGLGGSYKVGIAEARYDYLMMVPGDNSWPAESLNAILSLLGQADIVIPYMADPKGKPFLRRIGSWGFTTLINFLFGLKTRYYNGLVVHRTELLRQISIKTSSFAYQAEALVKLLRQGHSFVHVGVTTQEQGGRSSKALHPQNLINVLRTILNVYLEVHNFTDQKKIGATSVASDQGLPRWTKIFFWTLSLTLIGLFVLAISGFHIWAIVQYPYFSPSSNVEEAAYSYVGANNFVTYGFLNSGFLQDYSSSSDPADHPYVYNHMPPGPDILTALLLIVSGNSYRFVRLFFVLISLAGIPVYLQFARSILRRFDLKGGVFLIPLLGVHALSVSMTRGQSSAAMLLIFAPLVALNAYYHTRRQFYLWGIPIIGLISAIYLEYHVQVAVLVCWTLLYFTQLIPLERKHWLLYVGTLFSGLGLKLLQNFLYLGPVLFCQELIWTLGNRTVGVPSQTSLKAFYRSIGVVHHGSRPIDGSTFIAQIKSNLTFPGLNPLAIAIGVALITLVIMSWERLDKERSEQPTAKSAKFMGTVVGQTWLWAISSVLAPIFVFPAFAQEVNLQGIGINMYFLSLAALVTFAYLLQKVILQRDFLHHAKVIVSDRPTLTRFLAGALILVLLELAFPALPIVKGLKILIYGLLLLLLATLVWRPQVWETVLLTVKQGIRQFTKPAHINPLRSVVLLVLWIGLSITLLAGVKQVIQVNQEQFKAFITTSVTRNYEGLSDLKHFSGELYMTNINTLTVGFFTKAPGYGVCGSDAVREDGTPDQSKCKVAFMRQYERYNQMQPRYYYFFSTPVLFPGFADCLPSGYLAGQERGGNNCIAEKRQQLAARYPKVFQNDLFEVYDLQASVSSPNQPNHSRG